MNNPFLHAISIDKGNNLKMDISSTTNMQPDTPNDQLFVIKRLWLRLVVKKATKLVI